MMRYIGIDPGVSGAIACLDVMESGLVDFSWIGLDETDGDVKRFLEEEYDCSFCILEKPAGAPPGQRQYKSIATLNDSIGFCRGILTGLVPYETVSPAKWQKAMGCLSKGDKKITKAKAQQLFPSYKITHRNADALLLAEYCRRLRTGQLNAGDQK